MQNLGHSAAVPGLQKGSTARDLSGHGRSIQAWNGTKMDTHLCCNETLYALCPPNHRDGVVYHTRTDAEKDNEHLDGKTTE